MRRGSAKQHMFRIVVRRKSSGTLGFVIAGLAASIVLFLPTPVFAVLSHAPLDSLQEDKILVVFHLSSLAPKTSAQSS